MNRRDFTLSVAAAGIGSVLANNTNMKKTRKPMRLNMGDKIGLIAPAGILTQEKIDNSHKKLKEYGFRVKEGEFLRARNGYLAGTDDQRLADLHAMYADPEVRGIWCARGGYGCTRLLDKLNYKLIKKNPKVLIGYSDVTALLNGIYQKTGLIGFHGPVGASPDNEYSRSILRDQVMFPDKKVSIPVYSKEDAKYEPLHVFSGGSASGRAVGGNLSLMAAMAGTPYQIRCEGMIVFIEDVGEEPYRIDRMLTQLTSGTDLSKAAGIVLGQFRGCNPDHPERSLSLFQVLEDRLGSLGIPCIYGLNFGHVDHNFTFPVGGEVAVDFDNGMIQVLESVVI